VLTRLLNFCGADKLFFHFFQSFFEQSSGPICRVKSPFNGTRRGLASFFLAFLKVFLNPKKMRITRIPRIFRKMDFLFNCWPETYPQKIGKLIHEELSRKILGAAMDVLNEIKPGL